MKKTLKILALVLAMVMALAFTGCTAQPTVEPDKKTTLVFGTSADYPPYEFHILNENGEDTIVGIDVFLAQKIAEDMGLELVIKDINFDYLIQELGNGSVDIVIAAIEADEDRLSVVDMSDPYYTDLPPVMLVRAGEVDQYTTIESLSGKTIGAQNATTKADVVGELEGVQPLLIASVNDLVNNLVNGKCDGILLDAGVAMSHAATNPDVAACTISFGDQDAVAPYRVAFQKGDPDGLGDAINATIAKAIEEGLIDQWVAQANELQGQALE